MFNYAVHLPGFLRFPNHRENGLPEAVFNALAYSLLLDSSYRH